MMLGAKAGRDLHGEDAEGPSEPVSDALWGLDLARVPLVVVREREVRQELASE